MTTGENIDTALHKLITKWRTSADRSWEMLLRTNSAKEPEWAVELETNANDLRMCADEAEAVLAAAQKEIERLREAISWALGYPPREGESFRERRKGEGAYWWRSELRARAALAQTQEIK